MVNFKKHRSVFFVKDRASDGKGLKDSVPTSWFGRGGASSQHMLGFSYSQDPLQESAGMVKGMVAHCTQVVAETRYLPKLNVYQSFQPSFFLKKSLYKNLVFAQEYPKGRANTLHPGAPCIWLEDVFFWGNRKSPLDIHSYSSRMT